MPLILALFRISVLQLTIPRLLGIRNFFKHMDWPDFLNIYTKDNNVLNLLSNDSELDDACVKTLTKNRKLDVDLDYGIDGMRKDDLDNEGQDNTECGDDVGVQKGEDDVEVQKGKEDVRVGEDEETVAIGEDQETDGVGEDEDDVHEKNLEDFFDSDYDMNEDDDNGEGSDKGKGAGVDKGKGESADKSKVEDDDNGVHGGQGFRTDAIEEIVVHISNDQAYRAKRRVLKILDASLDDKFALLCDSASEIKRTNPDYNFVSDKQKWLIIAFQQVFPNSDYRFCVRYNRSNFKTASFRGLAFKDALWKAAKATTPDEFSRKMDEMRDLNDEAADWFNDKPPEQWNDCYSVDTYKKVYGPAIMRINGRSEWVKTGFIPPQPPNSGRSAGRPEIARRVEADQVKTKQKGGG
ncbi:hypothetical protein BUALT_Bualt04G0066200 [Buddleja alternifolia]|uniref:Transposase n=1 Tax=Buddleja alternifolia TaxID=168488 RepID=A0AAV6XY26_9LAMI|nr:hypothetical protein BUALT_Bualt04G0066200 [Buddleja alternifolia]